MASEEGNRERLDWLQWRAIRGGSDEDTGKEGEEARAGDVGPSSAGREEGAARAQGASPGLSGPVFNLKLVLMNKWKN